MIHDGMLYDWIRGLKVVKRPISKSVFSADRMHLIKRLMVNYDTPREYLNSNGTEL